MFTDKVSPKNENIWERNAGIGMEASGWTQQPRHAYLPDCVRMHACVWTRLAGKGVGLG